MAELDFMVLGDFVRADNGVLHIVAAGIDQIVVENVPTAQTIGVGIRLLFTRNECDREHILELIFQDEDGHRLVELSLPMTPGVPPNLADGARPSAVVNANLTLPLPQVGAYGLELLLDGNSLKSVPLHVVSRQSHVV